MSETLLTLGIRGFPPRSARGCVQTLTPIKTGSFRRTVNGTLVYTGNPAHHKYASTIFCKDKTSVALEGVWRGAEVTVGCIQELCQEFKEGKEPLQTQPLTLDRPAVKGSVRALDETETRIHLEETTSQTFVFRKGEEASEEESHLLYVYYRPLLKMRVLDFSFTTEEWNDSVSWMVKLEEI